jgi:DNA-binding response OmpR family regulator
MRVLVAVDGPVGEILAGAGHAVVRCAPREVLARCEAERFDVVAVSDEAMASRLRLARPAQSVVVVTRPGDVEARIRALEAGADDAFDAAFAPSQMIARVGAAGRRAALVPRDAERVEVDGCVLDLSACEARRGERGVSLSSREVAILRWLLRHRGRVVSRRELLEHVFGVSPDNATRSVDVAIATLRAKIERDARAPAIVVSVKGEGYRWGAGV